MGPPQPRFLNGVVRLRTSRTPGALLRLTQALERAAGRRPGPRWGPRSLDLDLLMIDDLVLRTPALVLPHSGLPLRSFVLEPMCDLDPDLEHPELGLSMATLLQRCGS